MPPAGRFPHGTRARYVTGCRCAPCTKSNRTRIATRGRLAIKLVKELPYLPPVPVQRRVGNVRWSGSITVNTGCPGIDGKPCATKSCLRKDSINGRCEQCRWRLVWDGLVPATAARRHLAKLARQGVGRRAVGAVSNVPDSTIVKIKSGLRKQIRRSTERRILDVDVISARGQASLLSSAQTYRIIDWFLDQGVSVERLRKRLKVNHQFPITDGRRELITARLALQVQRHFLSLFEGDDDGPPRTVFLEGRRV